MFLPVRMGQEKQHSCVQLQYNLYPMAQKYQMNYNNSEIDIIENAILPITNIVTQNASKILDIIKTIIGGEVVYENDTFFIVKYA
jgi:hypothetical protein